MAVNESAPITDTGIPGWSVSSVYDTGAQGSTGGQHHPGGGGEYGPQRVSDPYNSAQAPADLPTAMQGYDSTASTIDVMKDVVSGAVTPVAAPPGHVVTPHHPGAGA